MSSHHPAPVPVITSLTVVCRLRAGTDPDDARRVLTDVPEDVHSPFAASSRTHFARLLVLDQVVVRRRAPLPVPVVVLSADFDGDDAESYLRELLADEDAARSLAGVLALCAGAPHDAEAERFTADVVGYLLDRRLDIGLLYVDDARHHGAAEIRRAVHRHRQLVGFARGHQGDPPDELRRAFRRTFTTPVRAVP